MPLGLSVWWTIGWAIGATVVVVVALVILVIIGLARSIANETNEIAGGLRGVKDKTIALSHLSRTHLALTHITIGLRRARGESDLPPNPRGLR